MVLLYTDGILEAMDPYENAFGRQRLSRVVADHLDKDLATLVHALVTAVTGFVGNQTLQDDVCLVGVEARPTP